MCLYKRKAKIGDTDTNIEDWPSPAWKRKIPSGSADNLVGILHPWQVSFRENLPFPPSNMLHESPVGARGAVMPSSDQLRKESGLDIQGPPR